jgi:aspartate aminotransferase
VRAAFERGGMKTPLEFADRLLKEASVAVVPGEAFGTDDHVRISYATSMKEIERGMDRLQKFVEKLG